MIRLLRRFWPATLRMQLMLVLLPIVGLPVIATGDVLKLRSHEAFLAEKHTYLHGIDVLPARHLEGYGGFRRPMDEHAGDPDDNDCADSVALCERICVPGAAPVGTPTGNHHNPLTILQFQDRHASCPVSAAFQQA